jgi:hypothetical protein
MKNILFLAITATIMSCGTSAQPPLVIGEANLTVDKDVHDFGVLEVGADGSCKFIVTNMGDQPLIISKCDKTCGCTVPSCDPTPINPKGTSEITVTYDTKRLGPFNKSVTVHSNDPDEPVKVLRVTGEVKES